MTASDNDEESKAEISDDEYCRPQSIASGKINHDDVQETNSKEEVKAMECDAQEDQNFELDHYVESPEMLEVEENLLKYDHEEFILGEQENNLEFSGEHLYKSLLN